MTEQVSGVPTPQEPEITATTQTIKPITWAPTAITGAVERTSELIRNRERYPFIGEQMLTDLCCLVDATRALLSEGERPTIPDDLRRQFEYAVAAVRYGVTCEPGNPESATGITAGEALTEADSFLAAFESWLAGDRS